MTAQVSPPPPSPTGAEEEALDVACRRAVDGLLAQQRPDGHWSYRLETNVCMDAEYLLLGRIVGRDDPAREARLVRRILDDQRGDGSFATHAGGPADPDVTLEALVALRAAGLPIDHPRVAAARAASERLGGVEATRVFTRIWLACCGHYPWERLPELPPELMLLPDRAPLSLARFASWARATIVPLLVVIARRLRSDRVHLDPGDLPPGVPGVTARPGPGGPVAGAFRGLDRILHAYRRAPLHPGRERALRRAEAWILDHQERDGGIGGIQPPMAYQVLALHALGYGPGHPAMERAWNAFEGFILEDGERCEVQACLSPVWDTGLAMLALADLGVAPEHPAMVAGARWLLGKEVHTRGDWAAMRPRLPVGGWPFEYDNELYPDIDDTAIVLAALRRAEPQPGTEEALARGLRWMLGMQSHGGGMAAFDADNTTRLPLRIPFCDFGAVIDPPTADVTAHVVEACALLGLRRDHHRVDAMVRWLLSEQESDGAWFGRWGVNYVYGTAAAIPALVATGIPTGAAVIRRAAGWLRSVQHPDGAWGEDCASYPHPERRGRGEATPSQTGWGLQGLCAAGEADSDAARRAAGWLLAHQREDGLWYDERFTGTGFPGDFYLRYHGYACYFPAAALGRYRRMRRSADAA